MHGCLFSTVAKIGLGLKHQAITIHGTDCRVFVLGQFYIETVQLHLIALAIKITFLKKFQLFMGWMQIPNAMDPVNICLVWLPALDPADSAGPQDMTFTMLFRYVMTGRTGSTASF